MSEALLSIAGLSHSQCLVRRPWPCRTPEGIPPRRPTLARWQLCSVFRAGLPAGINPLDPLAYVAVAGLLAVTAAVASYAPTRRALRIEPIKALRVD